jgi:predicted PurR-regulated permease PerM
VRPSYGFGAHFPMKNKEIYLIIAFAVLFAGLLVLVCSMGAIFLPVLISLILAYLLEPLVIPLEKRGVNRSLAVFLVFCACFVLIAAAAALFVTSLVAEFRDVQINLPDYAARLYNIIPQQIKVYLDIETPAKVYAHATRMLDELRGVSFDLFKETFTIVKKAFASTLAFILAVLGYFIIPVYLYYFIKDLPQLKGGIVELVPERYRARLGEKGREIDKLLAAFIRGQLSVCAILAVLYSIGLYLIGIDLGVMIGTLAGITFIIPYFGTILGIILSMTMAFLKFHDVLHPLLCLGWFGLVQLFEGAIITPKIVGDKVGLHPVVTILALLVGGQLFGILGMLLAVPVTAVLKVLFRSFLEVYRSTAFYQGS